MSNLDVQYKWVELTGIWYDEAAHWSWEFLAFPADEVEFEKLHQGMMDDTSLRMLNAWKTEFSNAQSRSHRDPPLTDITWEFKIPPSGIILYEINCNIQRSNELLAHNRLLRNTLDIFEQEDSDSS